MAKRIFNSNISIIKSKGFNGDFYVKNTKFSKKISKKCYDISEKRVIIFINRMI